jgi:ABC-2 type transport system ATP-binding protein
MIELQDIQLIFGNEKRKWPWSKPTESRTIFDGLSARIEEGHAVALRGVNGCGKTTLLRLIYGALLPSRGEVRVLGTPTSAWSHPHPAVALLYPRDWVLQWRLTIRQNLEFFGFMARLSRKDTAYRIDALAETFGVRERLEQRAWMLSSGEQQRVSLVRAMIRQPQVLLLDEPTRAIDQASRPIIWQALNHLRKTEKMTIVVASHFDDEIEALEAKVLQLDELTPRPAENPLKVLKGGRA